MDTCEENTAVQNMKQCYSAFMPASTSLRQHQSMSNASGTSNHTMDKHSVSVQKLIEQDRKQRLFCAELSRAKGDITDLESKLLTAETSRKRSRVEYETELHNIQTKHRYELDKTLDMQRQVRELRLGKDEAEATVQEMRHQLDATKSRLEQKVHTLQREKLKSEADTLEREQSMRTKIMELKTEKMRQDTELQICCSELEEVKDQLQISNKRRMEANKQASELEEAHSQIQEAEHKIRELEMKLKQQESDATVAKNMRSHLSRLQQIETENRKFKEENKYLKDTQDNMLLLREEVESLKSKLERADFTNSEYTKLQLKYQDMEQRLKKWETSDLQGKQHSTSPEELAVRVVELQASNVMLLEQQGQLKTSVNVQASELQRLEELLHKSQTELAQATTKTTQNADLIKRFQRKLMLVSKERDGYKKIIDSYEDEVTVNVSAGVTKRLQMGEENVQAYREHAQQLETQLNAVTEKLTQSSARAKVLESQLLLMKQRPATTILAASTDAKLVLQLRGQISDLEHKLEEVNTKREDLLNSLEQRQLQGEYDPMTTQVLHLTSNPFSIARAAHVQEVGRLRGENDKLKQRLGVLESGGMEDITEHVEEKSAESCSSQALEEVKKNLTAAERKNNRLMEAFSKKSQEIREAYYQLLGFRLDITGNQQYRLINVYAESPSDQLLFQQSDAGDMQLLETEYSSTMTEKMEMYLQGSGSIPAFLSSITMELYSRQTMLQSMIT